MSLILALLLALPISLTVLVSQPDAPPPPPHKISFESPIQLFGTIREEPGPQDADLLQLTRQIQHQLKLTPKAVTLVITSPGGEFGPKAEILLAYLDRLAEDGVEVNCIGDRVVASLAAVIFSHCNYRFSTPGTVFMVHSAGAGMMVPRMTEQSAKAIYERFRDLNNLVWAKFKALIDDEDYWQVNFDNERLIPAAELASKYPQVLSLVTIP